MSFESDDESLAPGFLVAAPKLEGSPFERAVIAMVHHDDDGAMGFIVNKPVEIDFGTLLQNAEETVTEEIDPATFDKTVSFGGPVRVEQLWVLYHAPGPREAPTEAELTGAAGGVEQFEEVAEWAFHDDWVVAGSGSVIESFARGDRDATFHPIIGYSGWGPGQLEGEIEEGSWLAVDFDDTLLLETEPDERWEAALDIVGLDPQSFIMMGEGGMA